MSQNAAFKVIKNIVALSTARASVILLSFVFVVYAARILGVSDFGKYALIRTYFDLFLDLCTTGLCIILIREIAKKPSLVSQYLNTSMLLVLILAVAASSILIILAQTFHYAPDTQAALYLVCVALLPATISAVLEAAFIAFEKAEYITYGAILENMLRTMLSLFVLFQGYGVLALFMILIATRLFMLMFYLVLLSRHITKLHWYFEWAFLKQLVHGWKIFALENWLSNIFWSLDVILLSFFFGERAVGLYAAANKLLSLGSAFATSYTSAIFPFMSRMFEESRKTFQRLSQGSLKYMLVLIFPSVLTIALLADPLISLLYPGEYANAIPILRVLIWVLLFRFLNPFLSHILFAQGEQRKSLQVVAISLAFYVAICLWFIPRWEAIGAAWAVLLAVTVAFCLYYNFVFRKEGEMNPLGTLGRPVLAILGTGMFVLIMWDSHLVLLLISALVLYVLLLIIFRVPSSTDIELFRGIAMQGLRRFGTILRRA
jgi:O-antigen/teichoic acid export membrane protein